MVISTPPWTLTHSFYAVMGGYAFDLSKCPPFLPGCPKRITITPLGVVFLTKHAPEVLPDLTRDQIEDKSKASVIAKTIVCVQALWFCLQCVARVAEALPFSLLEVITFAHAAFTLVTYYLWWCKPLDISQPPLVQADSILPLCAYMWMSSKMQSNHKNEFSMLTVHENSGSYSNMATDVKE